MSGVVHPVGPQQPAVYWTRRILVVLVVAALIFLIFRFVGGRSETPPPSAGPTPPISSPTTSPTETPTKSPTKSPSKSPTGKSKSCAEDQITVTAATDKQKYRTGVNPVLRMSIATTSDVACTRDIGAPANELRVLRDGALFWSSDHCNPGGTSDVATLTPGQTYSVTVAWQRQGSAPGCPGNPPAAQSGTYQVFGRNGDVRSEPVTFVLG